jgi:putative FmdB family regulatory protein
MPTYDYECKSCGHAFEAFQNMSDIPLKDCPKCGMEVRRLINGGSGVIFKGSGFYVTDKKAAPGGKTKDAKKTDEKKPETASSAGAVCASCPAAAASGGSCPASGNETKAAG